MKDPTEIQLNKLMPQQQLVRLEEQLQQERAARQAEQQEHQRRIAEMEQQVAAAQAGWNDGHCCMPLHFLAHDCSIFCTF